MGRSAARVISTGSPRDPEDRVGCPTGRAPKLSHPLSQTPSGLVLAGTPRKTDSAIFVAS